MKRQITRDDILPIERYAAIRAETRRRMIEHKRNRRLHIGPHATASFECWQTMWHQVQEMLYTEKGGEAQLEGELSAYNPLIPRGTDLVATVMIEVEDEARRRRLLASLGGIERSMALVFAGQRVAGKPEEDLERSTADGKASSVHFLHFPFTAEQIALFRTPGTQIGFAIEHPNYQHTALLPEAVRATLAEDFD